MSYPIHIAFCVNDGYLPYILVTIMSLAQAHPTQMVHVHILTDRLSDASYQRLADEFGFMENLRVEVHLVDDSPLRGLQAWSKYTWYRLLIQDALPEDVHRVLYLDADTLVCDDLSSLFAIDMADKAVAGVEDPMSFDDEAYVRCGYDKSKQYLCAGVLMLNLDYWRQHNLSQTLIDWGVEHVDIKFHDQDCINFICQDTKVVLPLRYGVIDSLFLCRQVYTGPYLAQTRECLDSPAIIHYAGCAPWLKDVPEHPERYRWHQCNARLKRPVRMSYKSKGLILAKVIVHSILNPKYRRRRVTAEYISRQLEAAQK